MRTALKTAASKPAGDIPTGPATAKGAKPARAPSAKENAPVHVLEADTFPVTLPNVIIIARIPYKGTTFAKSPNGEIRANAQEISKAQAATASPAQCDAANKATVNTVNNASFTRASQLCALRKEHEDIVLP